MSDILRNDKTNQTKSRILMEKKTQVEVRKDFTRRKDFHYCAIFPRSTAATEESQHGISLNIVI